MNSTNNTENNSSESNLCDSFGFGFDKNEYYTENGLSLNTKRDSKSRNKKAVAKKEGREQKIVDKIDQLPKKMRAKLEQEKAALTTSGKVKQTLIPNIVHNRKLSDPSNATQKIMCQDYDEHALGEEDCIEDFAAIEAEEEQEAQEALLIMKQEQEEALLIMKQENQEALLIMKQEQEEQEKAEYIAYTEAKMLWDFPDEGMSRYDLLRVKQSIETYEATMKEIATMKETDICCNDDECASLWERYGLSVEQYLAHQKYLKDCDLLQNYEYSYSDVTELTPKQARKLKERIAAYEKEQDQMRQDISEKDDQNDWWMPEQKVEVVEEDEVISYAEWLENKREEDLESFRQEMIEDNMD